MAPSAKVDISDDVILESVTRILTNIDGIHSLSTRFYDGLVEEITNKLGQKRWTGMNVKRKEDDNKIPFIEINIYIRAFWGYKLGELGRTIQHQVRQDMLNMLGLNRVRVDVHFEGLERKESKKIIE